MEINKAVEVRVKDRSMYIFNILSTWTRLALPDPQPQLEKLVRNSHLMSRVGIGLQKPYTKTKVGESCTCVMFIDIM